MANKLDKKYLDCLSERFITIAIDDTHIFAIRIFADHVERAIGVSVEHSYKHLTFDIRPIAIDPRFGSIHCTRNTAWCQLD
jgi:hypothetical protein